MNFVAKKMAKLCQKSGKSDTLKNLSKAIKIFVHFQSLWWRLKLAHFWLDRQMTRIIEREKHPNSSMCSCTATVFGLSNKPSVGSLLSKASHVTSCSKKSQIRW